MMICVPRDEKNFDAIEKLLRKSIPEIDTPLPPALARTEASQAEEKKPVRSRIRKIDRSRPRAVTGGKTATAASPAEARTPVVVEEGTQARPVVPQIVHESEKSRIPRRAARDKGARNETKVVGLGDHLPGFIALSFKER
jgi:ATP-dependent RNA helicase RhlE